MKVNLHLKTVKIKIVLLLFCLIQTISLSAQNISEWRSAASGDFANASGTVWEKNVLGVWTLQAAAAKPSSSSNVTIRTGHTVTLSATTSILGLTIESGAVFNSTTGVSSPITLRIGTSSSSDITAGYTNNVVIIQNDGLLGSTTAGTNDGINLEVSKDCKTLTLQGSGICRIGRTRFLYPNPNSPATFNINQNMYLGYAGGGSFTAYYNNGSNTATENNVINLMAGKTVTLVAGGSFHGSVSGTTPPSNPQGTMTYNISGTLDLSATTSGGLQTSTAGTPSLNLNIKNGGLMKLGTSFGAYKGGANGSINMVIEDGGIVDGSLLTAGVTNNSSTLNTGYTWFVTAGTGVLKQTVNSTSMTFPVGISSSSYNPVTLNNGGGQVFSVGVAAGNAPAGLTNVTKALNRTWKIVPVSLVNAVSDITFGYNNGDGNANCVLTDPMQLQNYATTDWSSLGTATPSVPSTGGVGFQVGYSGITSFGSFNLVNGATIPVEMIAFKAFAKGSVNVLDWSTATERNNSEFAIERSLNGRDFQSIGSVKGNGNSNVVQDYSFTDEAAPLSIAYYRLRQIDFDGNENISKAVTVARLGNTKVSLEKLYPSVTSDVLTLELTTNGNTVLSITDVLGRVVSTKQLGNISGFAIQQLDVSSFANGLYFIHIQTNNTFIAAKFEKK